MIIKQVKCKERLGCDMRGWILYSICVANIGMERMEWNSRLAGFVESMVLWRGEEGQGRDSICMSFHIPTARENFLSVSRLGNLVGPKSKIDNKINIIIIHSYAYSFALLLLQQLLLKFLLLSSQLLSLLWSIATAIVYGGDARAHPAIQ